MINKELSGRSGTDPTPTAATTTHPTLQMGCKEMKGVHKKHIAKATKNMSPKARNYSDLTLYRQLELLCDERVTNPPLVLRVKRGHYIPNLRALKDVGPSFFDRKESKPNIVGRS